MINFTTNIDPFLGQLKRPRRVNNWMVFFVIWPSRSRSRSRSDRRHKSSRYSRSVSRSPDYRRSHSHSPMSSRRRHTGTRENPKPSRCLGVFGLSVYTTEDELYHIFNKYGPVERVQVVIDAKVGRRLLYIIWAAQGTSAKAKKVNSKLKFSLNLEKEKLFLSKEGTF